MQQRFCKVCRRTFLGVTTKHCPACGRPVSRARVPSEILKKLREPERRPTYDLIILGDPCTYCGRMAWPMTIDHIEPQAAGGSKRSWTNRTGACYDCNQTKADKKLLFFLLDAQPESLIS